MYLLQQFDLSKINPPAMVGAPVCSVAVVAAPRGLVGATIAAAASGLAIPLPPAGMSIGFRDALLQGVVVAAPKGSSGILLLGFNIDLEGAPYGNLAGGVAYRINAQTQNVA